jgi:hypothetical protein
MEKFMCGFLIGCVFQCFVLYWAESHFGLDYKSGQKTVRVEAAKKGFGEYQLDKINGDVDFRWKK